ncbi:hypothetical protein K461DRAFT_302248 [Myriangium duriaei CBS 260.36]|uniref:Uncharacterized protein n=1 Tax=Myriangium duriaei CBS 260.36 TaxID=1168546 RepID=A0A9P4IUD7_9PEZI|nr:hypothetical protein K461DRAFT_302248 [Myriangium duriaei CBS 260.36]
MKDFFDMSSRNDGIQRPYTPPIPVPSYWEITHGENLEDLLYHGAALSTWHSYLRARICCLPLTDEYDKERNDCGRLMEVCSYRTWACEARKKNFAAGDHDQEPRTCLSDPTEIVDLTAEVLRRPDIIDLTVEMTQSTETTRLTERDTLMSETCTPVIASEDEGIQLPSEPLYPIPDFVVIDYAQTHDELDALEDTLDAWNNYFQKRLECLPYTAEYIEARHVCEDAIYICTEKQTYCSICRLIFMSKDALDARRGL